MSAEARPLAVITYDAPHLKTEEILSGLLINGCGNIEVFALPFVPRPARAVAFAHRPDMATGATPRDICAATGTTFNAIGGPEDIPTTPFAYYLIAGAGLLPPDFVADTAGRVLNAHPGLIPLVRGLDSFKWAIVDGQPIGNTLHFIDAEADAGEVIARVRTPLYRGDSLETFAARHYRMEIQMLVAFDAMLQRRPGLTAEHEAPRPARMRMPAEIESGLQAAFEGYRAEFCVAATS